MITIFNNAKRKEIVKKNFLASSFLGFASSSHSKNFPEVPFCIKNTYDIYLTNLYMIVIIMA